MFRARRSKLWTVSPGPRLIIMLTVIIAIMLTIILINIVIMKTVCRFGI